MRPATQARHGHDGVEMGERRHERLTCGVFCWTGQQCRSLAAAADNGLGLLCSLPQALHFSGELEEQLIGFLSRQPLCHVGEHGLPHPGIPLRPRHLLG
jgi:hypothetical protein